MDKIQFIQGVEITIIGIAVVFAGLILTFFMINLFSILPEILFFLKKKGKRKNDNGKYNISEDVSKEHLLVIMTVLDIEMKMRQLLEKGKFTFK